jgi:glycine/serine hydroxymethyltransferase
VVAGNAEEGTPRHDLWKAIRRRAFPGMVSNHHLGTMVGLLFAAVEMNTFREDYQPRVIANAKAFAKALAAEGLRVQGDDAVNYTETHQVLVDVGHGRGPQLARQLEEANIVTNYQALPHDEGFTAASGLRLGVAEMTRFGMNEADFEEFAALFAAAVRGEPGVAEPVSVFRCRFREMRYCFDEKTLGGAAERLARTL